MRLPVLAALSAAVVAIAFPAAATSPVTVTPHDPVNPTVIADDKAAIQADKQALLLDTKGTPEYEAERVALDTAKLQLALDIQARGVPGPLEGVGLPFVLLGAAGAAVTWSRHRRRGGEAHVNTSAS